MATQWEKGMKISRKLNMNQKIYLIRSGRITDHKFTEISITVNLPKQPKIRYCVGSSTFSNENIKESDTFFTKKEEARAFLIQKVLEM